MEAEEQYDKIFNNALILKRAILTDGDEEIYDWGNLVANLLFTIANEWEKDPHHFPLRVLEDAHAVAGVIEDLVIGKDIDRLMSEVEEV